MPRLFRLLLRNVDCWHLTAESLLGMAISQRQMLWLKFMSPPQRHRIQRQVNMKRNMPSFLDQLGTPLKGYPRSRAPSRSTKASLVITSQFNSSLYSNMLHTLFFWELSPITPLNANLFIRVCSLGTQTKTMSYTLLYLCNVCFLTPLFSCFSFLKPFF